MFTIYVCVYVQWSERHIWIIHMKPLMLLLFIIAAWDWLMTFERKRRGKKLPTTNIKATQSLKSFSCLFLKKPNTITYNHTLPKMTIATNWSTDHSDRLRGRSYTAPAYGHSCIYTYYLL